MADLFSSLTATTPATSSTPTAASATSQQTPPDDETGVDAYRSDRSSGHKSIGHHKFSSVRQGQPHEVDKAINKMNNNNNNNDNDNDNDKVSNIDASDANGVNIKAPSEGTGKLLSGAPPQQQHQQKQQSQPQQQQPQPESNDDHPESNRQQDHHLDDNLANNRANSSNYRGDRASQRTKNSANQSLAVDSQFILTNTNSKSKSNNNYELDKQPNQQRQQQQDTNLSNHTVHSFNHNNISNTTNTNNNKSTSTNNQLHSKKSAYHQPSSNHSITGDNQNNQEEDLSYLQKLLSKRWPLYALAVCIMAPLLVAIVSSIISAYLTCGTYAFLAPPGSAQPASQSALLDVNGETGGSGSTVNNFTRLPSSLWPVHYDLFIQPYIREPFDFDGKVSIRMRCTQATSNISMHAKDLELDRDSLKLTLVPLDNANWQKKDMSKVPAIVDLTQDKQLQYSIIHLDDNLTPGREYIVSIKFKGLLNDDLAGFYRIKYDDQNGRTNWIAATQFQATDARKAFPCFDEPLYKATFGITIKHWTNMSALSNMPLEHSDPNETPGWVVDRFAVSHRMSTYLVAFAVTNFESKTLGNITVWARPGFIQTADYALNITGKILKHYETFFGIDFPLPKMDMIALPDFNAGAMENWGLITYRETAMLYDEKISSVSNKQRVATVVAHELAHQWFGNLVTPKWWDDLWLNEGFASYVEYIGVDHVEPGWKMLDQFVVEEQQDVLKADSLSTSHQISIPVNNPDEINEIFDRISYGKGASIIRMMNHFLTEEVFKAGLREYLKALKYGNAEQSDLWRHLTEVQSTINNSSSNSRQIVDVKKVMNSWTLQTGFPLVTLTRDYDNNRAKLEQQRFQILSKEGTPIDRLSKWEIPITMTSADKPDWTPRTKLWMHQDDAGPHELDAKLVPGPHQWMLVNVDQVGYYRVNYDVRNWQLLIEQLATNHEAIAAINRAQILDDIFDLAKNGLIDYKFAMNATKYLKRETDFLAWDTVLRSFIFIDDMLQRSPVYGEWKEYISELIEDFYNNYKDQGWTIDGMNDTRTKNDVLAQYNRVNAISWACQVNQHCIKKARKLFDDWRTTGINNIDPSLRSILYCNVIENGDKSDWEFLWKKYEKEQSANEKDRLLRSMACSKELWILSRYLEWTFDKSRPIRRQDGSFVFRAVARNNYGRDVAFNFLRDRWQTIKEYYGKSSFSFSSLIKSVTNSLNTNFELQQLIAFYKSIRNDVGTAKRSFLQSIEEVESNTAWMSKYYKTIESWIREARGKPHL